MITFDVMSNFRFAACKAPHGTGWIRAVNYRTTPNPAICITTNGPFYAAVDTVVHRLELGAANADTGTNQQTK
jgi:hypothetical protein